MATIESGRGKIGKWKCCLYTLFYVGGNRKFKYEMFSSSNDVYSNFLFSCDSIKKVSFFLSNSLRLRLTQPERKRKTRRRIILTRRAWRKEYEIVHKKQKRLECNIILDETHGGEGLHKIGKQIENFNQSHLEIGCVGMLFVTRRRRGDSLKQQTREQLQRFTNKNDEKWHIGSEFCKYKSRVRQEIFIHFPLPKTFLIRSIKCQPSLAGAIAWRTTTGTWTFTNRKTSWTWEAKSEIHRAKIQREKPSRT